MMRGHLWNPLSMTNSQVWRFGDKTWCQCLPGPSAPLYSSLWLWMLRGRAGSHKQKAKVWAIELELLHLSRGVSSFYEPIEIQLTSCTFCQWQEPPRHTDTHTDRPPLITSNTEMVRHTDDQCSLLLSRCAEKVFRLTWNPWIQLESKFKWASCGPTLTSDLLLHSVAWQVHYHHVNPANQWWRHPFRTPSPLVHVPQPSVWKGRLYTFLLLPVLFFVHLTSYSSCFFAVRLCQIYVNVLP